jgi:hypothetical protein
MMPGLVPGIFVFATAGWSGAMIAMSFQRHCESEATKQSIYRVCRALDCFASLAMTAAAFV